MKEGQDTHRSRNRTGSAACLPCGLTCGQARQVATNTHLQPCPKSDTRVAPVQECNKLLQTAESSLTVPAPATPEPWCEVGAMRAEPCSVEDDPSTKQSTIVTLHVQHGRADHSPQSHAPKLADSQLTGARPDADCSTTCLSMLALKRPTNQPWRMCTIARIRPIRWRAGPSIAPCKASIATLAFVHIPGVTIRHRLRHRRVRRLEPYLIGPASDQRKRKRSAFSPTLECPLASAVVHLPSK